MKIEIKNLTKNYGDNIALNNISLTLTNGIYGLIGANGAGKSTLMNLITDNISRTSGEILCEGEEILSLGKTFRKKLGYMPQQQGFYDNLSARSFILYMASLKGLSRSQAKKEADELLDVVNLRYVAHKRVGEFSGGMKQRVLLAQAMLGNPDILLLDEPTAGLDPKERIRIRNFISEIAKDKIVLISTHVVSDIEFIAKEIILLKDGRLISNGSCSNLLTEIDNKVFEIEVKGEQLQKVQSTLRVSNLRYEGENIIARAVCDNAPVDYTYTAVKPTLEDLYLYYFE